MDHNQSVDFSFRDQPGRNGSFAERRRGTEDALIVSGNLRDRFLLKRSKLTLELRINRPAPVPFVPDFGPDLVRFKKNPRSPSDIHGAQRYAERILLPHAGLTWLVVRREPHGLSLVKLWVLKCSQPE